MRIPLTEDEKELVVQWRIAKSWGHAKLSAIVRNGKLSNMELTKQIKY